MNGIDNKNLNIRIHQIYETYLTVISPFIIQLEILDSEYPVEIMNELRAILTHISRCYTTKNQELIEDNINKAERHVKRAVLDCYKYLCVSYDEFYKSFERQYENVDMSVIDNGDFLPHLSKKRKIAIESISNAKRKELILENADDVFEDFENAYHAFSDVYNLINASYDKLQRQKHKATAKEWIGVAWGIIGTIGTIFGILGFLL